ncbi:MAG: hypothetical protein LBQ60_20805 [Bacteroidales bacterium]|jgi:hypothetical protein|nr:hypothetical protein [Bacteroidales bacterium]
MKNKSIQTILICVVVCFLLFNIVLLFFNQLYKRELNSMHHRSQHLKGIESMFEASKGITVTRLKYEQYNIGNTSVYLGSDKNTLIPVHSITDQPKLVLGLNQNMCRPCVEGIFTDIKEFFPDFESNPDIICIADIEQRFKDNFYGKKVISFHQKNDFPLYEIVGVPFFFILDKDLCVKLLFITDSTSPELTKEYLKNIKERYPQI